MIPIPYGERRICTVTSGARKLVVCEHCHKAYVYLAFRQGQGTGENYLWLMGEQAEEQARREAEAEVESRLAEAIEPVPCPGCGWYQANMIEPARSHHLYRWHRAGFWLVLFGGVLMFFFWLFHEYFPEWPPGHVGFRLTQAAVLAGAALMIIRFVLAQRYQPNSLPLEHRLMMGRALADLVEDPRAARRASHQGQGECHA
jgi:hypothetical protein